MPVDGMVSVWGSNRALRLEECFWFEGPSKDPNYFGFSLKVQILSDPPDMGWQAPGSLERHKISSNSQQLVNGHAHCGGLSKRNPSRIHHQAPISELPRSRAQKHWCTGAQDSLAIHRTAGCRMTMSRILTVYGCGYRRLYQTTFLYRELPEYNTKRGIVSLFSLIKNMI